MPNENLSKLEQLNTHLKAILDICNENDGIVKALSDERMLKPAILMHFIVAYECLKKIQNNNEITMLSLFTKDEINGLNTIRNISSHDYEGINLSIIENTIRYFLPNLVAKIDDFLAKI